MCVLFEESNKHSSHICCLFFYSLRSFTCLDAKHVQDKAARWARAKRPKKHRKSDIFRAPTNYPVIVKPEEYTIVMAEGEDAALSAVIIPSNRGSRNAVLKRLTRKEKEAQGN